MLPYLFLSYGSAAGDTPIGFPCPLPLFVGLARGPEAPHVPEAYVAPSDRLALEAIRSLLLATNEFSHVLLAAAPTAADKFPSGWRSIAFLESLGNPRIDRDGSPRMTWNVGTYRLTLYAQAPRGREGQFDRIDRLKNVAMNTLLSPAHRAYGGFCKPWASRLVPLGDPRPTDLGVRREFRGEFGYSVSHSKGYSTAV